MKRSIQPLIATWSEHDHGHTARLMAVRNDSRLQRCPDCNGQGGWAEAGDGISDFMTFAAWERQYVSEYHTCPRCGGRGVTRRWKHG